MSKFLYTLSIIFVIAKIFGLVTFSWFVCLLPALCVILVECLMYGYLTKSLKELFKELIDITDDLKV